MPSLNVEKPSYSKFSGSTYASALTAKFFAHLTDTVASKQLMNGLKQRIMELEIVPEDDHLKSRQEKTNGTHISAKAISSKADKNPWKGKYDRRKKPRDGDEVFSEPLAANDKEFRKHKP